MSKHTPTPWVLSKESPTIFKRDFSSIGSDSGYLIGSVMGRDDSGFYSDEAEARANARLIVTAVNYHDRLREALREVTATLAWVAHGECRAIQDGPIMPSAQAQEVARALLDELDNLEPKP